MDMAGEKICLLIQALIMPIHLIFEVNPNRCAKIIIGSAFIARMANGFTCWIHSLI